MVLDASYVLSETIKAVEEGYRYIIHKGGSRSGKSYGVMQFLILLVMQTPGKRVTVTSSDLPHTKRGCMRDLEGILSSWGREDDFEVNRSSLIWKNKYTGSFIEFATFDIVAKAKGPQRDLLLIDEANHVSWAIADQLFIRTSETIFLTYNPTSSFWANQYLFDRPDTKIIHSTYHDNKFLSETQIAEIEGHKDKNFRRVYIYGLEGMVEEQVYTNWDVIDEISEVGSRANTYYGIDFGFTQDPTAIIKVVRLGSDLYVDELCYSKGMLNSDISRKLKASGVTLSSNVVADSAEQKSIAEINTTGLRVKGVKKYPSSIKEGISLLQGFNIHITKRSENLKEELTRYSFKRDSITDEILNEPIDKYNHLLDALRYVALTYFVGPKPKMKSYLHEI